MRSTARSLFAGVAAYTLTYFLVGLATVGRLGTYLAVGPPGGPSLRAVYQDAGGPVWQAVGWLTLNAHGVPLRVAVPDGAIVTLANLLVNDGKWLGTIPGWVGLLPAVACLLAGAAIVATSEPPTPVGWHVGAGMTAGYLGAVLISTVLFSGTVGPVDASFTLIDGYPADRWLLPAVLAPLLFGSAGAMLGRSPALRAAADRASGADL